MTYLSMPKIFYNLSLCFILVTCFSILFTGCTGQKEINEPLAFVEKIEKGTAYIKKNNFNDFTELISNSALYAGDTIKTDEKAEVVIRYSTGATSRIMPATLFKIEPPKLVQTSQKTIYTRILQGLVYFYVERDKEGAKKLEIETERAIASIKGTSFKIEHNKIATELSVAEGKVAFTDKKTGKSVDVEAFQKCSITDSGISEIETFNFMEDKYFTESMQIQMFEKTTGQ